MFVSLPTLLIYHSFLCPVAELSLAVVADLWREDVVHALTLGAELVCCSA